LILIKHKLALLVACFGLGVAPALSHLSQSYGGAISTEDYSGTGERAAALKKCNKKHGVKKKRCRKKARNLPA
jgi:hypothetical protein